MHFFLWFVRLVVKLFLFSFCRGMDNINLNSGSPNAEVENDFRPSKAHKRNAVLSHFELCMNKQWSEFTREEVDIQCLQQFTTYLKNAILSYNTAKNYLGTLRTMAQHQWGEACLLNTHFAKSEFSKCVNDMKFFYSTADAQDRKRGVSQKADALTLEMQQDISKFLFSQGKAAGYDDRFMSSLAFQCITRPQDLCNIRARDWTWNEHLKGLYVTLSRDKKGTTDQHRISAVPMGVSYIDFHSDVSHCLATSVLLGAI
jgi:hypothetical protein